MGARFVMVGWGYRAQAWLTAAQGIGVTCAGTVVRTPRDTPVPAYSSLAEALKATGADFVVASVSIASAPDVMREAVALGVPIMTETPPGPDAESLRALWNDVGASGLVQVAEQYPHYPSHAARLAVVRSGVIGMPTQVQVSSTQLHHAAALMRAYQDLAPGPAVVRATATTAPLLQPILRTGWTGVTEPEPAVTTHAVVTFGGRPGDRSPDGSAGESGGAEQAGDGHSGIYDFTDWQTRNLLRFRRLVVRGTHGELDGEQVLYWGGPESVLTSQIERRQSGHDLDMSGYDSETLSFNGEVVWRNRWPGLHWSDDQHATASILSAMADWVAGSGPEPYPLAQGCQDSAIGWAFETSARTGEPVVLDNEPWW